MCFGGRLHCRNCPANQWWFRRYNNRRPDIHHENWPVPLIGARGTVKVKDFVAEVTVEQRFENKEEQPLEVTYEFNIDPKASIIRFQAEVDGKKIVGELKEKEEARNTYDDAIAAGHGAYMLEQKSDKVFQASIGNLPPGKEVLVTIIYVTELAFNDAGQLRLTLPEQGFAPDGRKSRQFPKPTTIDAQINSARVPDGLTLEIEFDMTSPIVQISSDTHPQLFNSNIDPKDARKASVKVPTSLIPLMTNFELILQLEDSSKLINHVQKDSKGNRIVMVAFHPRLHDIEPRGEIIFVVDRSGSMMGSKMTHTKDTMQIFLRSLTSGVRFNILSFGSTFSTLFEKSKDYDSESLAAASAHVNQMGANMGGTELLEPLNSIFGSPPNPVYPRQVFVLTDGEVSNTSACIQACRRSAQNTRVFCFGIGSGASEELCKGMARAANGDFEMIRDGARIDEQVLKQLAHALQPAITNVQVSWPETVIQTAPHRFSNVFNGQSIISYAWIPQEMSGSFPVRFHAVSSSSEETIDETIEINLNDIQEGTFLFALAAKKLLDDFDQKTSFAHNSDGRILADWSDEKIKQESIKLSLETGVLCKYTAFIAVEERRDFSAQGNMIMRKIVQSSEPREPEEQYSDSDEDEDAVSPTKGLWSAARGSRGGRGGGRGGGGGGRGGFKSLSDRHGRSFDGGRPSELQSISQDSDGSREKKRKKKVDQDKDFERDGKVTRKRERPPSSESSQSFASVPPPSPAVDLSLLKSVIMRQSAEGFWPLEAAAEALKIGISGLRAKIASLGSLSASESLIATAIICVFFEQRMASEKLTWMLVVKKARLWLGKQAATSSLGGLMDIAKKIVEGSR